MAESVQGPASSVKLPSFSDGLIAEHSARTGPAAGLFERTRDSFAVDVPGAGKIGFGGATLVLSAQLGLLARRQAVLTVASFLVGAFERRVPRIGSDRAGEDAMRRLKQAFPPTNVGFTEAHLWLPCDQVASRTRVYASDMRFVQPITMVLGLVAYVAFFALYYWVNTDHGPSVADGLVWMVVIIVAWNVLAVVATIIAIVDAVRGIRSGRTRQLTTNAMVVKLASIPFLSLSCLLVALAFFGGALALLAGGPAYWVVGAIDAVLTCLVWLSTSIYLWAAIAQLRRGRILGTGLTVLYAVLSLVPVADVAAGVAVFAHSRRRPRLLLIVGSLLLGVAIIALGGLGFLLFLPAAGDSLDPSAIVAGSPAFVGIGLVIAAGVVSIVQRSKLRAEAEADARVGEGTSRRP